MQLSTREVIDGIFADAATGDLEQVLRWWARRRHARGRHDRRRRSSARTRSATTSRCTTGRCPRSPTSRSGSSCRARPRWSSGCRHRGGRGGPSTASTRTAATILPARHRHLPRGERPHRARGVVVRRRLAAPTPGRADRPRRIAAHATSRCPRIPLRRRRHELACRDDVERIDWVRRKLPAAAPIGEEFADTRPFDGLTIGTGIHLEPKTAALLLTLARGGARVVATGNLNSTQPDDRRLPDRDAASRSSVGPTADPPSTTVTCGQVLARSRTCCSTTAATCSSATSRGPTPACAAARRRRRRAAMRLAPLRDGSACPVLVINDSPIKQFAENTPRGRARACSSPTCVSRTGSTNGRGSSSSATGRAGRGVAANFRNAYALVTVLETDPVKRLEANLDGFDVPPRDVALRDGRHRHHRHRRARRCSPRPTCALRKDGVIADERRALSRARSTSTAPRRPGASVRRDDVGGRDPTFSSPTAAASTC